ncbi:MAG: MerR family transcriptional regulator [Deltaproteobacteria bacterium]|nr:MerR family transcriptional regulator [Deltaproteobacteria bacterium]
MKETKESFIKRKKDEKRSQAQRQVEQAFAECQEFFDEFGEPILGSIVDGKLEQWRIKMEPEIEDLYSTLDIVKALNIPRERLRDWMTRGFIKPSLPSTGKGTIAIFTKADVFGVALFGKLLEKGFKREVAAEYIEMVLSQNLYKAINLILFKSVIRDGKRVVDIEGQIGKGPLKVEIDKKGNAKVISGSFENPIAEEWEDIHILNVGNLFKEVDAALTENG